MSLFSFSRFMLDDLAYAPDQMVIYEGYDEKGKLTGRYGLFDLGDGSMDTVSFDNLIAKGETEIRFVYDLRNNRFFKITVVDSYAAATAHSCPSLLDEKGHAPDQFSTYYDDYEAAAAAKIAAGEGEFDEDDEDFDEDEEDGEDEDDQIFEEEKGCEA